jgi:hypothetical protein
MEGGAGRVKRSSELSSVVGWLQKVVSIRGGSERDSLSNHVTEHSPKFETVS